MSIFKILKRDRQAAMDGTGSFSPGPYVLFGYIVLFVAFGVFGAWAATAPLEGAVVAQGTISVESNRKTIQHLEGGIISEIYVDEGDIVEPGDPLIKLDPTQAMGNYAVLNTRASVLQANEARLVAESTQSPEIEFPDRLLESENEEVKQAVDLQRTLFEDRLQTKEGQTAILHARMEQLENSIDGLIQNRDSVAARQASLQDEITRLGTGQESGVVATNQYSRLQREKLTLDGEHGSLVSEIAKSRQTIAETELQIAQLNQEYVERASSELRDVRDQLNEVEERLTVARDVLDRTLVTAPVRGMVQSIEFHTTGGVVRAAEPLMDIIPLDDNLLVSARIRPTDIDSLSIGMRAEVRFPSFSSRTTPVIFGEVRVLSQDVIQPQQQNAEPYYSARIEVTDDSLPISLRERLLPGMPADIIIATGDRTLFQYLVKPLEDSFQKGLREQ